MWKGPKRWHSSQILLFQQLFSMGADRFLDPPKYRTASEKTYRASKGYKNNPNMPYFPRTSQVQPSLSACRVHECLLVQTFTEHDVCRRKSDAAKLPLPGWNSLPMSTEESQICQQSHADHVTSQVIRTMRLRNTKKVQVIKITPHALRLTESSSYGGKCCNG